MKLKMSSSYVRKSCCLEFREGALSYYSKVKAFIQPLAVVRHPDYRNQVPIFTTVK